MKIDINTYTNKYITEEEIKSYQSKIIDIKETMIEKKEMLDWFDIDSCISENEIQDIEQTSKFIKNNCDVFLVVGIGGSFLGAKAVIEALTPYFNNQTPRILFPSTSLSTEYLSELRNYLQDKNIIMNIISKSGTTLETSIVFTYLLEIMKEKYTKEQLKQRIIITTDNENGFLRELATKQNYKSFAIPKNIGGRFSVLTTVGLLPIAVANINIRQLLQGARTNSQDLKNAYNYAIVRECLAQKGKKIESFTFYEPKLESFGEWLKQLFAETQGKEGKGIFPITTINTRDLHSLGQYFQEGQDIIFETVIRINNTKELTINPTKLNLNKLNHNIEESVIKAHYKDHTPSIVITIDKLNEETLGELIYFFEVSSATGAYLLELNPFDQPGVEKYKQEIKANLN